MNDKDISSIIRNTFRVIAFDLNIKILHFSKKCKRHLQSNFLKSTKILYPVHFTLFMFLEKIIVCLVPNLMSFTAELFQPDEFH